jgi:uncharacterized membrane protein HdeD (DUF308 family)
VEGIVAAFLGLLLLIAVGATLLFLVQVLSLYLSIAGLFRIIGIFVDSSLWSWKLVAGLPGVIGDSSGIAATKPFLECQPARGRNFP